MNPNNELATPMYNHEGRLTFTAGRDNLVTAGSVWFLPGRMLNFGQSFQVTGRQLREVRR